jgi:2-oxoisovalerate dehydrogenase E1 component
MGTRSHESPEEHGRQVAVGNGHGAHAGASLAASGVAVLRPRPLTIDLRSPSARVTETADDATSDRESKRARKARDKAEKAARKARKQAKSGKTDKPGTHKPGKTDKPGKPDGKAKKAKPDKPDGKARKAKPDKPDGKAKKAKPDKRDGKAKKGRSSDRKVEAARNKSAAAKQKAAPTHKSRSKGSARAGAVAQRDDPVAPVVPLAATTPAPPATAAGPAAAPSAAPRRRTRRGRRVGDYDPEELRRDLLLARISRAIDDREIALQKQSRVFFQISGAGHEALLLGLAHELRPGYDWFFPYYRDLALMLGLGQSPEQILLQAVGSADDPASGGRQMPAHWGDPERNVVTQSSPTGSQCIPAVGCAEAGRYIVKRPRLGLPAHGDELTYVSLGEGATSEGEFWESLNTACVEHLPVLFVVADNGYAISVPASEQSPAPIDELVRGFAGLQIRSIDGTDYFAVRRTARKVVSHVRAGVGPALIHARVTRPYSHSAADTQSKYRLPQELTWEVEHDPIDRLERALVDGGVLTTEDAEAIRAEARETVAEAAKAALRGARPDPGTVLDQVVALPDIPDPGEAATGPDGGGPDGGDVVALGEAIRRTLHEVMEADERIRVFGEDVADAREAIMADVEGKGGVFGTTHGLQRSFGRARCFNTPLAEANIIGRAVGQGIRGLRPAPEIQFFDYIWPAMQQIRSEAATIRWRSNGAFTCPTVMRVPIGGYLQGGSIWHSQSGESIFAHIPGLLVAFPSRASDAAGLLRAAFRCEDPVLFLEHKHLLRQPYTRDPFPDADFVLPFGRARYVRRGTDLTIVTWGATVERSRLAAEQIAEADGAEVEIVDLRTLVPWDQEMVAESVTRTSRLLVVHEDVLRGGFGGEIAAWAADQSFWQLDAPIGRVGAQDCHVAYAPELEDVILPQPGDIAAAARRVLTA